MPPTLSQLLGWFTFDNFLRLLIAVLASVAIFILELYFLKNRPATNRVDKPASFFELDELASVARLRTLATFYALPGAALFLVMALAAKPFVDAAKAFLSLQIAGNVGGVEAKQSVEALLRVVPDWLNPAFVLVVTLILFSPVIRKPFEFLRTLALFAIGIETRANRFSIDCARTALDDAAFDKIQDRLERKFGKTPPLPVELVSSSESTKLAYQLLYFSEEQIRKIGLRNGINLTLEKIGIEIEPPDRRPPLRYGDLLAAFTFYTVLCVAYVFVAPLIGPWLQTNPIVKSLLQPIEWPQTADVLVLSVAQRTFSFIVPLAFGMQYFVNRDPAGDNIARSFRRMGIVFSWQFLASAILNFIFVSLMILKRRSGEFHDAWISLGDAKIWADIFTCSLAPGLALSAWVACGGFRQRWLAYLVLCLTAGVAFYLGQFAYEGISKDWRGYYWHEMTLGVYLTISYLCGAFIARDVVILPREPTTGNAPTQRRLAQRG